MYTYICILQSQLSQSQSKVNELTKELAVERSVTDNAKVASYVSQPYDELYNMLL